MERRRAKESVGQRRNANVRRFSGADVDADAPKSEAWDLGETRELERSASVPSIN